MAGSDIRNLVVILFFFRGGFCILLPDGDREVDSSATVAVGGGDFCTDS